MVVTTLWMVTVARTVSVIVSTFVCVRGVMVVLRVRSWVSVAGVVVTISVKTTVSTRVLCSVGTTVTVSVTVVAAGVTVSTRSAEQS